MSSSQQRRWDFEAISADDGGGGGGGDEQVRQAKAYGGLYVISNEVNMTNCYKRCEYFFEIYDCIHFKVLIAYWIMAGYLGNRVRSVEEAYEKGLDCLFDLVYKEKILKLSDDDRNMIEFAGSSTNANCRHPGFCFDKNIFREILRSTPVFYEGMSGVRKVVLSEDEMLSMNGRASVLHWAQNRGRDKYVAVFNPSPDSLKALLENVKNPSVLLLRGFDKLSLPIDSFPLHKLKNLTFLEISGSSQLTAIPESTISQLTCLRYLNLSDLPIEEFPCNFFRSFIMLHCLILRGCCKLLTLDLGRSAIHCNVLDLSHCTSLQNLVYPPYNSWFSRFRVLDLSYTPFDPFQLISSPPDLSHLYLRGSKLEDFSFLIQLHSIEILDLSGCSCFTKLDEGLVNNMSNLQKLDLSWTKVKHLPSLANLTSLRVLSLRGLELDSLETLASLSDRLVELDLSGLNIISSSQLELKLDFLQSLENLQILNLSQTSVAKLPDMSTLVSLKELLLADCQHLKVVPDLQPITNLETLDLSLPNASSSNNHPLEFETKGHLSSFSVPKSIRKLVLTNRYSIQKLFPVTTLANLNLEFLDLRGTDVIGLDSKLEAQQPQERNPKPIEIHIVSVDDESNSQQPNQPSDFDHFTDDKSVKWDALFSDIQMKLNSTMAQEQVEMLHNDLRYIQENYDRLKSSSNWKSSKELLQEFMDAATNLSAPDFALDSASIKQLLRIVVKLKLLVPRKQIDDSEALEVTKKKKKKPLFRRSQENDLVTDIVKGMQRMEPDLLNSYKSLSTIQKACLLCFSIFPYNEVRDENTGLVKSLVIKKKILIYWWVGEGFIDAHHKENVAPEPTLNQNLYPDPNANTNPDQEMMMSRDFEARGEEAIEQFSATKVVKKPITVEEIGNHILNVLAEKGFIAPMMKKGRESGSCCIHPFVHSFVIERAKEECFLDFDQESGKLAPRFTRSHKACLLKPQGSIPSSCTLWANYIKSRNRLKSFKTVNTLFNVNETMIDIKREWFSKMKNLSVLHLGIWQSESTDLIEVSDQKFMVDLKKMRQLRVLSLQGMPTIMKLPDSICYLSNLIILDLRECNYLEELPADIGYLKSLTHLDISNCPLLYKLPKGISLLSKLEVLRGFVITDVLQAVRGSQFRSVSTLSRWWEKTKQCGLFCCKNNEACTLRDLLKLERLRELSIIVNISKFPEHEDLQVFKEMKKLCKLKILWQRSICTENTKRATGQESSDGSSRWQNKRQQSQDGGQEDDREESEHLHSIEKLELWCFPYENAPYWLNPRELRSLKKLYIVGGNLKKFHGSDTDENRWNVGTLRLKYLRNLDIQWHELKIMFPQLIYFEKAQCDQLVLFPCNEEGAWRSAS